MIGLGFSIMEREIRAEYGYHKNDNIRIMLLTVNLLTTILLIVSLLFAYLMKFNWMLAKGTYTEIDGLINTGMYKPLIAECVVCFISPMPFIYDETFEEDNINFPGTTTHFYNDILL